jgi:hypothetical protein
MNRDEHNLLLGRAVNASHGLEMISAWTLARALGIDAHRGHIVASTAGLLGTLRIIEALSVRDEFALSREDVTGWLKAAHKARDARNRVIHTPWIADGEEGANVVGTLKKGLTFELRSGETLAADVALIDAACTLAAQIRDANLSKPTLIGHPSASDEPQDI